MKYIYILLLGLILILGCKKNPLDYRTKYIGEYNFSIHKKSWDISGNTLDTNYFYTGEVKKGTEKDMIIINYSEFNTIETSIYEDGTLDNCICSYNGNLEGEFESKKSIKFVFSSNGLGGGKEYIVSGEKK